MGGDHGSSLLSFPTPVKWAHDTDDINVNLLRFADAAENPVGFTGPPATEVMGSESTENPSPGTALEFLGVVWLCEIHTVPEAVIGKVHAYPTPKP